MACILDNTTVEISNGEDYNGITAGFNGTQTYQFTTLYNEIVTFYINLQNVNGGLPNAVLTLYKIDDNGTDIIEVGSAQLNQFNNTFTYDALQDNYMICITSIFPVQITINLDFTTYAGVLLQPFLAYNGSSSDIEFEQPPSSTCQSDVNYEFLHGELPEGFTFRSDGIVFGETGEQDCVTNDDEAPSYMWVETNSDGDLDSTGRPYYFTVRAFLEDYPDVFDDRLFKVCVRNNWSKDVTDHGDVLTAEYECIEDD